MGAKTIEVQQVGNPCQQCGGPQIGKIHYDSYGNAEMIIVRCLKCRGEKRLYSGRREPRFRKGYAEAMGVKEKYARKG